MVKFDFSNKGIFKNIIILWLISFLISSCAMGLRGYTPEQITGFDQFVANTDTPEKIVSWQEDNFSYDWSKFHKMKAGTASNAKIWRGYMYDCASYPIEIYYKKRGVCSGWANFSAYILREHGFKVKVVYARDNTHFVTAFKRDGKWWKICIRPYMHIGDEKFIEGPYDTFKDVALSIKLRKKFRDWGTFRIKG